MNKSRAQTAGGVWGEYRKGCLFKSSAGLYDTVEQNENFYLGKQWEGVVSNGLPTPVFNLTEQIVGHLVSSLVNDNIKLQATPMDASRRLPRKRTERICDVVNGQFERIFENVKLTAKIRECMRNCAVDGDGCFYAWFDPDKQNGQPVPGDIELETVENTRVVFGNPNSNRVEKQPYIILARREMLGDIRRRAKAFGGEPDAVRPDADDVSPANEPGSGDKATVLIKLWKDRGDGGAPGTVRAFECTASAVVRPEWDLGIGVYPVAWMNWNFVQNRYHGQAVVTSLIPNQIFVNKLFAMTMLSLMTTAYPKVVYDKTRIVKWDNRVGSAIPVNGGDMKNVAHIMDPAQVSPQIRTFMDAAIKYTKDFKGASDTALGNVRPENTSAIIALQRAAAMPLELVRQNLYQFIEDLGRIFLAFMGSFYGKRYVEAESGEPDAAPELFDFGVLSRTPLSLKLDVGAASYWSEIASVQTLDNLLKLGKIDTADYFERLPRGFVPGLSELAAKARNEAAQSLMPAGGAGAGTDGAAKEAGVSKLENALLKAAGS